MYGLKTKDKNNFLTLLLILKFAEYKKSADSLSEILLFLAKYSFLFQNLLIESDLCEAENSQLYIAQENREIGARYLDPKYSRWISADPAMSYYVEGKSNGSSGGIYNPINLNLYHYAGNNPIRYIDPTGLEEDVSESEKQLKRLKEIGAEMFNKGTINGINLYLENDEDGCFARATVIAGELEKEGFEVTDYSYVTSPVLPGVIKKEKAAGRDPSKVPDKDKNGKPNRFKFHVAATVIIDGKKYVVDPFYHKSWLSVSEQEDWYSCQYPKGTSTQPAHDAKGNLIAPATMKLLRTKSGYTGTMSITEYAQGWLKNYDKVKRDNKKNNTNNDPYIWSGK